MVSQGEVGLCLWCWMWNGEQPYRPSHCSAISELLPPPFAHLDMTWMMHANIHKTLSINVTKTNNIKYHIACRLLLIWRPVYANAVHDIGCMGGCGVYNECHSFIIERSSRKRNRRRWMIHMTYTASDATCISKYQINATVISCHKISKLWWSILKWILTNFEPSVVLLISAIILI